MSFFAITFAVWIKGPVILKRKQHRFEWIHIFPRYVFTLSDVE